MDKASPRFTIVAEELPLHPDTPGDLRTYYSLADGGQRVATGMDEAGVLEALDARSIDAERVLVKKGALGRDADQVATARVLIAAGKAKA